MALVLANRVRETTTTTGTGTVTLAGAVTGYQSFSAVGNGNTTYYTISGQGTSEWEVGIGTYTSSGTTLSRDTVLASSNSGSLVSFSAGTKDVFVTYPSNKSVYLDASGNASALGTPSSGNLANCTGYTGTSALVTVGALNSGSITSGFGSIDVGADSISGGAFNASGKITGTATGIGIQLTRTAATAGYIEITDGTRRTTLGTAASDEQFVGSVSAHDFSVSAGGSNLYGKVGGDIAWKATSAGINIYGSAVAGAGSITAGAISGTTGTHSSGVSVGGATAQSSGVAFPATAVAVANANTLDDYEEGTWTPTLGGTSTYNAQTGTYTKIGRLVYAYCDMAVNALGTGGQTINGLPFAAAGGSEPSSTLWNSLAINAVYLAFYSNGTGLYHQSATAGAASLTDGATIFTSGTAVKIGIVYQT